MFDLEARGMRPISVYAPFRVFLTGFWRLIFGLLIAVPAATLIWIGPGGEPGAPHAPGDLPPWWMFFVGLVLAFVALSFVASAFGRMVSAFSSQCYLYAGPHGLAYCIPKRGWFGRFTLPRVEVRWDQVRQLVNFTHRINLIPVSRELHIELLDGQKLVIERAFFKASVKTIQQELLEIVALNLR